MDSERWKQVEAIYHSALEIDADARADFLAVACAGDEALRREVLSLISSAGRADSFMEEPLTSLGLMLMNSRHESLAGQTVARYLLIELLGRGGMGEVYLAHDPNLNRRVALKLLPDAITEERARVRRFEQEARAASAISHPNVAHIYEIGEAQGQHYITMEYVRGRTLREALQRGPLAVNEALSIAAQITAALTAAHEAGVFHRDIKPENVMLRADGYVKVLDFGLAKLAENSLHARAREVPSPSLHTEPELLMGTSDYMSPEQVRREPIDGRTDLWSLGVVIYEMLAGRRPFAGREPREVIVAILEREPEPLSSARPALPAVLQELVAKALRKRREERYSSAREMENELRRIRRSLGEGGYDPVPSPLGAQREGGAKPAEQPAAQTGKLSRPYGALGRMAGFEPGVPSSMRATALRRMRRPAYLLALLSLSAVALYLGLAGGRERALWGRKFDLEFKRLNLSGHITEVTLSPDGKYVARVVAEEGKHSIHITEIATASDLRIVQTSAVGYSGLSFSPDGTYVYYLENQVETGTLYRVSKLGGGQRKILDNVNTAATFSPDGARMAFVRSNRALGTPDLMVAQADGLSERLLARRTRSDEDAFMSDMKRAGPVWSPDGKALACPTFSIRREQEMNLEVLDAETGVGRRLNDKPWHDISRVAWLADGSGLAVSAAETPGATWQLYLIAYPSGEVRRVTKDPNNYTLVSGARNSSLFLTLNIEEDSSVWLISAPGEGSSAALDTTRRKGGAEALRSAPAVLGVTRRKGVAEILWGADGTVIFTVFDGDRTHLWAQDAGGAMRQLTFEADNFKPALSPDGRYIVFVSTRAGALNIWRANADGTQPVRLTSGAYEDVPSVTPDGRWVIYRTGSAIRKVSIDGGDTTSLIDRSALCPALSPDGRLLAFFTSDQPDSQKWHVEVYDLAALVAVKRFELPEATTPFNGLRLTPDNRLRWTPDGRGLAYVSHADEAANVWLQPLAGGAPRQLTHFKDAEIPSFAWSPDAKQLACVRNTKAYVPALVSFFD
jgi:Tol biopolymer transport system component/predicted Ser/Thr protein kinase